MCKGNALHRNDVVVRNGTSTSYPRKICLKCVCVFRALFAYTYVLYIHIHMYQGKFINILCVYSVVYGIVCTFWDWIIQQKHYNIYTNSHICTYGICTYDYVARCSSFYLLPHINSNFSIRALEDSLYMCAPFHSFYKYLTHTNKLYVHLCI